MSERDAAALDAVVTISRALAGEADLDAILDSVAKRARALVDARALAVEVLENGQLTLAAVAGDLPEGSVAARSDAPGAVLVVPLALRGRTYGALVAVDRQGGEPRFTVEDEEILEGLAALVAGAVAAQKFSQVQRPVVLDHVGLGGAIELLADLVEEPGMEVCTRLNLAFEEGRAEDRLDGEVETALYRIVQEGLDSAVEYARASRVQIEVAEDDELEVVRIEIRVDGGFDPAEDGQGSGVAGMREWVELLGGSIRLSSATGEGARIAATLPSGRRWRSMLKIN